MHKSYLVIISRIVNTRWESLSQGNIINLPHWLPEDHSEGSWRLENETLWTPSSSTLSAQTSSAGCRCFMQRVFSSGWSSSPLKSLESWVDGGVSSLKQVCSLRFLWSCVRVGSHANDLCDQSKGEDWVTVCLSSGQIGKTKPRKIVCCYVSTSNLNWLTLHLPTSWCYCILCLFNLKRHYICFFVFLVPNQQIWFRSQSEVERSHSCEVMSSTNSAAWLDLWSLFLLKRGEASALFSVQTEGCAAAPPPPPSPPSPHQPTPPTPGWFKSAQATPGW